MQGHFTRKKRCGGLVRGLIQRKPAGDGIFQYISKALDRHPVRPAWTYNTVISIRETMLDRHIIHLAIIVSNCKCAHLLFAPKDPVGLTTFLQDSVTRGTICYTSSVFVCASNITEYRHIYSYRRGTAKMRPLFN